MELKGADKGGYYCTCTEICDCDKPKFKKPPKTQQEIDNAAEDAEFDKKEH